MSQFIRVSIKLKCIDRLKTVLFQLDRNTTTMTDLKESVKARYCMLNHQVSLYFNNTQTYELGKVQLRTGEEIDAIDLLRDNDRLMIEVI